MTASRRLGRLVGDLGTLLAGIGGLILAAIAVVSLVQSSRARKEAAEAKATSPAALFEGLRGQVKAVVDAYGEAVQRFQDERDGMESSLRRERARADGAEVVGLQLRARLAEASIDVATLRSEVADLRARFDAAMAPKM